MPEIKLYTERKPTTKYHGHKTQTIHGLEIEGEDTTFFHNRYTAYPPIVERIKKLGGFATTEMVTLGDTQAERLKQFTAEHLVRPSDETTSCMAFINYVYGFADSVAEAIGDMRYEMGDPVDALEDGKPYAVANDDNRVLHTMIGTRDPNRGWSITGNNHPLEILDIKTMKGEIYEGGTHIRPLLKVTPQSKLEQ